MSDVAQAENSNLPGPPRDKYDALIHNLIIHDTIYDAAIASGYSESTAKTAIYKTLKKPAFQQKYKQFLIDNSLVDAYKVSKIYRSVIKHIHDMDPEKKIDALSKSGVTRIIDNSLKISGLIQPDISDNRPVTVNIQSVQNMLLKSHDKE